MIDNNAKKLELDANQQIIREFENRERELIEENQERELEVENLKKSISKDRHGILFQN